MYAWVVALVVAAVVSAAAVGVSAATGKYEQGGINDAFGDFFKYTMLAWGGSLVGQGVGAAAGDVAGAGAGAEGGMSASEIAAAEQAGSSAQLVSGGVDATAGIGATTEGVAETAMIGDELAMMEAEMAAANYSGPSAFDAVPEVGLSAANTTGQNAPSLLDSVFNTNSLDFKKGLFEKLVGEESYANYESLNGPYTDLVDEFISGADDRFGPQEPVDDPRLAALAQQLRTFNTDFKGGFEQGGLWDEQQMQFNLDTQNQPIGSFSPGTASFDMPEYGGDFGGGDFQQFSPDKTFGNESLFALLGEGDEEDPFREQSDWLTSNLWYV